MRIGVFGGTFDPVHLGHLWIARAIRDELALDKLFMVVAGDPPHKHDDKRLAGDIRYRLLELAVMGENGISASDIEIKRQGRSYTVDTLELLKGKYRGSKLYWIVGGDMLVDFPQWRSPQRILSMADLVAVARPGVVDDMNVLANSIKASYGGEIIVSAVSGPNISSTEVRRRMYEALPIDTLVPRRVELHIYRNALYMPEDIRKIRSKLCDLLGNRRLVHTMLTVREAILLANTHGVDPKRARLAAILHDCVKLHNKELLAYARSRCYDLTKEEIENPYLIHARLGAVVAMDDYGVKDEEALKAIENHTLGRIGMSKLDKVIYLADKLEQSRDYEGLQQMREIAYKDLNAGMVAVMKHSIEFNQTSGRTLNPITPLVMQSIIDEMDKNGGN